MGYKVLGYAVWNGGLWFLRRRYGRLMPSRRVAAVGVVGLAVAALAVVATRREHDAS